MTVSTLRMLEKGTSNNEDARLRRGVNCEIPHRFASKDVRPQREQVTVSTQRTLEKGTSNSEDTGL